MSGTVRIAAAVPDFTSHVSAPERPLLGVIEGEGIGPEVIDACLRLVHALAECEGIVFDVRHGGKIGSEALRESGVALSPEVDGFCEWLFEEGGSLLCGPGGVRFVYDLRRRFDLYCKLIPLKPLPALADTGPLRPEYVAGVDILVVRENVSGLYFSNSSLSCEADGMVARHAFEYRAPEIDRILQVALNAARMRRGRLCVIHKPGGVEAISELWRQRAQALNADEAIALEFLEVDNASYQLIASPRRFDVVVAPNMFGDVLADGASALLASRGLSYSANYGPGGRSVYQTGHGAAYDIAGQDVANPLGQIQSFAMMLRESYGLTAQACCLDAAIADVLEAGWRTLDMMLPGRKEVGTREMARLVEEAFRARLRSRSKS
ncbi:isocitrate/isopropylmalate family dehydrogenase [Magnetospirillum moscoviense]|uniref:isocitrate/isopropylmalate family dehydrogenase n=1 Tax=Magnetospirillum moscoviense TaxID=1437059 RepID=UPI0009EF0A59|nr:isocitrate/isopropylmalate family dehydrogenase [Magnetospirillum moscoviense]